MSLFTDREMFHYDFAEEDNAKLGKANGNIFVLKSGVEGEHSGVVMVRLKKKRYVVLDYSFSPSLEHMKQAEQNPHCEIPEGAGVAKCTSQNCTRVGVPVLLWDSQPEETKSLYLRTGLCFECQRNINEKRRTERKRKGDVKPDPGVVMFPVGSSKKVKVGNKSVNVSSEAIILNGPPPGTKMSADGFSVQEISADLYDTVHLALSETNRLVNSTPGVLSEDVGIVYEKVHGALYKSMYLLTQWKTALEVSSGGEAGDAIDHNGNMVSLLLAANKKNDEIPFEQPTRSYDV